MNVGEKGVKWDSVGVPLPPGDAIGVKDVTLDSRARDLPVPGGATYSLRIGARGTGSKPAARWGLRITGADGKVYAFVRDEKAGQLDLLGRRTYFSPKIPGAGADDRENRDWTEMRIQVMPDRVRIVVNSRLHYQKFVRPGAAKKIEFFAEEGAAEFGRVEVWPKKYPADYKPRRCANTG